MKKINVSLFTTARLKLTFLYVVIILCITGSISFIFYQRAIGVIEIEFKKIEARFAAERSVTSDPEPHLRFLLFQDNYELAKNRILWQLIQVNLGVAVIFLLVSLYYSGKTLEPIEDALERQNRFVADAAHELRTPMAALRTSLEVGLMNKNNLKQYGNILKSGLEDLKNLEVLTESLLKLARLEESQFNFGEVDLNSVIKMAIKQLQGLSKKKNIKIVFKSEKDCKVIGDEGLVFELILILLDNAVKYSDCDSKVVILIGEQRGQVKVMIKDEGEGISKEDLPHIFERFYRSDESRCKNIVEGYGLGLSIAKRIADVLKGRVQLNSVYGQGTTALVVLPKA